MLIQLLLACVVCGVLVAAVALPAIGGLGVAARNSAERFDSLPTALQDDGRPPQKSVIVAADGQRIANLYLQNRTVVSLSEIAPIAQNALIAIEDNRFYSHHGVDVRGTFRALFRDALGGGASQGGSTLTQQYVKQVLLYSAKTPAQQAEATSDTVGRKLREAKLAVALENKISKKEILKRYLNIAYFGSGAYGIETAARTYFGVSAKDLNLPQAAMLAGLVQSPYGYDPHNHPDRAIARRHQVLEALNKYHYISTAQMDAADAAPLNLTKKNSEPANGCSEALLPDSGFFCAYVRSYLTNVLHLTQQQLFQGGLTIRTTIDPKTQASVLAALTKSVPKNNKNAAVMDVVEPGTGNIRAMAVNRDYGDKAGDPTQTTINLPTRPTANAGSTFKVFTLAAALMKHVPFAYEEPSPSTYHSALFDHTFQNDNASENGPYPLDRASVQSINTYFIQLLESPYFNGDLTLPVQLAQAMGLSANTLSSTEATQIVRNRQVSFTLGALSKGTSPLDMASVSATLAAEGKYCPPTPLVSITTPTGKSLPIKKAACTRALPKDVAIGVTDILQHDPSTQQPWVDFNTAKDAALDSKHPAAGKTGTTNDNSSVWFLGYTPQIGSAVAVFDPAAPSKQITGIPGLGKNPVYGSFAGQVWKNAVQPLVTGKPSWTWPKPDAKIINGDSTQLPCVQGKDSVAARQELTKAGFVVIDGPEVYSYDYEYGQVVEMSPQCGHRESKGTEITLSYSLGVSPVPTTQAPTTEPTTSAPPTSSSPPSSSTETSSSPPSSPPTSSSPPSSASSSRPPTSSNPPTKPSSHSPASSAKSNPPTSKSQPKKPNNSSGADGGG